MSNILSTAANSVAKWVNTAGALVKDVTGTGESTGGTTSTTASSNKSASTAAQGVSAEDVAADKKKLKEDYNNFLHLFLTQLQHQDPMAPLDNNQFTNSLANLSQVEQAVKTNERLETISALLTGSAAGRGDPVSYLGKTVDYEADHFALKSGKASFTYQTPEGTFDAIRLSVTDESGALVYGADLDKSAGGHTYAWDGKDRSGLALKDGIYRVKIEAMNAEKSQIVAVPAAVSGVVQETGFEDGKTMLNIDGAPAELASVIRVRNDS